MKYCAYCGSEEPHADPINDGINERCVCDECHRVGKDAWDNNDFRIDTTVIPLGPGRIE
jgi:hypothetical protein